MTIERQPVHFKYITLLLLCLATLTLAAEPSPITEAKRTAAADLARKGKLADAVALYQEVIQAQDVHYNDYLNLARLQEKLGQSSEALESYRQSLALIPNPPATVPERAARVECERRIKAMDAFSAKIDAAIAEFLKKLEAIAKEAKSAHNTIALQEISTLAQAVGGSIDTGPTYCKVAANKDWQPSGLTVQAGVTYRVQARGQWNLSEHKPEYLCTANGFSLSKATACQGLPRGLLIASINKKEPFIGIGEAATFTPKISGILYFKCNDWTLTDNEGQLDIAITKQ